jgi:hypothetical protein
MLLFSGTGTSEGNRALSLSSGPGVYVLRADHAAVTATDPHTATAATASSFRIHNVVFLTELLE